MDAKQIAKEVETILASAWASWTREAESKNWLGAPEGAIVVSRDMPHRYFADRAVSLAIAFEGRLLPENSTPLDPAELFDQVQMTVEMISEIGRIDCPERYAGIVELKKSTVELLGHCAVTGDHRFAKVSALLYVMLERCNTLKVAYEDADPNQIVNDMLNRH